MNPDQLHVVAVYSNPRRWNSRLRLAREFIQRMLDANVTLTFVEHAFGARPFEFDQFKPHANIVQLRGGPDQELWLKEALAKAGYARIPDSNWRYSALLDADIEFQRKDWAIETIEMLQHHRVGQPWTHAIDLGPQGNAVTNEWGNPVDRSFSAAWVAGDVFDDDASYGLKQSRSLLINKNRTDWRQHYGFAWAFRRDAYDGMGGLIDWLVTGSADYHMAMGFAGIMPIDARMNEGYNRRLREFANRCELHIRQDIGCLPGILMHHWHGKKKERFYLSRHDIMLASQFNPDVDLAWDCQGLPSLNIDNRVLRDGLRRYMMARNEDSTDAE